VSSTIIARANPPVKHMPTTPTPGPPQLSCSWRARARSHTVTGEVRPVTQVANSRDTHPQATVLSPLPTDGLAPGTPNRWGITAVHPSSTTRSANSTTFGVMPGISAITITAGPSPRRNTFRLFPSCVKLSSL
jgi:hypothetical protein